MKSNPDGTIEHVIEDRDRDRDRIFDVTCKTHTTTNYDIYHIPYIYNPTSLSSECLENYY